MIIKPNIGIFGRCNVGKSSLMNLLIGSETSIVSPQSGTTTDPVRRNVEILDYSAVTFYDTAGLDDTTALGSMRVGKSQDTLLLVDLAIVVTTSQTLCEVEKSFIAKIETVGIPYFIVCNSFDQSGKFHFNENSDSTRNQIFEMIKKALPLEQLGERDFFGGRISQGDKILMVCPIDGEAPSGRLILPQVQAIRAALDKGAVAITIQPSQIVDALKIENYKMVITDSSVIDIVEEIVQNRIYTATFSGLLAQLKGDMELYKSGLKKIDNLSNGDKVLILESCVHQVSCEDIGRHKLPKWLENYSGKKLQYTFVTANEPLPLDLDSFSLALQCGGCMVTTRQLQNRLRALKLASIPTTNYGMAIKKLLVK